MVHNKIHRIAYFVSHPIQYQAPLLRQLASQQDIDLTVFFLTDPSAHNHIDKGFKQKIDWDIPLLGGYQHSFLESTLSDKEYSLTNPAVKFSSVNKALKKQPWDAVWVHGYNNFALLYIIWQCIRLNTPLFFRCDSTLSSSKPKLFKNSFLKWLVKNTTALLWTSSLNKEYYQYYGAQAKQLHFSPHAVDNDFFQGYKTENKAVKADNEKCILLFASKFIKRKHAPLLLDAFQTLEPSIRQQAELWFVGDGEDKALLEQKIDAYDLSDQVFLLGFKNQSELPSVITQCDVFILPSEKEPFGLIINEVMNLSKPVITTNEVGAAHDLVSHQQNGWVIPANDVTALSSALKEAILGRKRLVAMGEKSLNKINQWSFNEDIQGIRSALNSI